MKILCQPEKYAWQLFDKKKKDKSFKEKIKNAIYTVCFLSVRKILCNIENKN